MKHKDSCSDSPTVSIGMPVYNGGQHIGTALESLLGQTFEDFEIIISDNASSDKTSKICQEYAVRDGRIRYIRQTKNIGPGKNFDFVKEKAKGDFFLWLADDDTISTDYIEKCVQYLVDNPDYVLVAGSAKFYRPDKSCYDGEVICLSDDSPAERIKKYFKTVSGNSVFYGVYRAEIVKQVSLPDILAGDWMFIAEIATIGKIHTFNNVAIHREASHLTLDDPWGRLFSYYNLPVWGKRFPEFWISLEMKWGIQKSKIIKKNVDIKQFGWTIFRQLLLEKYRKKISVKKIPSALLAILVHPKICSRRASHYYEI